MLNKNKADFQGWATKYGVICGDGITIMQGAFSDHDGKVVPLIWNHQHSHNSSVLGHALLESRPEGLYAYGFFNDTKGGRDAKEQVMHGDIDSLSILANDLVRHSNQLIHGCIRELSLVLAGANPGAFIESTISHGYPLDEDEEEGIIYSGEGIILSEGKNISHADPEKKPDEKPKEKEKEDPTVEDVLNTLNEDQKVAVGILLDSVTDGDYEGENDDDNGNDKGGKTMAHSLFENANAGGVQDAPQVLTHSDIKEIFKTAKKVGSLREGIKVYNEEHNGILAHALDTSGMMTPESENLPTKNNTYGVKGLEMFYPDYKSEAAEPAMISRNMTWVDVLMNSVGRSPFKRIKTLVANITEDEARAKGYIKGKQKKEEVFALLKRVTDPQTIYKKQKLDRDDILDIEDFDVVAWMRREMEVMLKEEKARAILIGDGRLADSEDKIYPDHIRPIATDVPLFNVPVRVAVKGLSESETAKETINTIIRSRKKYKGTGNPIFFTTSDVVTEMLLLENKNGDKIYKTIDELKTALRVSDIQEVEPMEGTKIKIGDATEAEDIIGVMVNPVDYRVGQKPNDESGMLEDFDIDYNQYKYLLEARMSGALVRPFSAVTFTKNITVAPVAPATPASLSDYGDSNE